MLLSKMLLFSSSGLSVASLEGEQEGDDMNTRSRKVLPNVEVLSHLLPPVPHDGLVLADA